MPHLHHRSARRTAAKRIDEIGFEEAAEMATFGAKILHPATLLPAVRSDIPVFVGSSKDVAAVAH
ncbi:amino acid kinase family protein [Budvicia aquatica]|uniref:amino acid kinase family protein n=1 Tax=Budvicia aquatica TaxID=82979 RepID=UPI0026A2AF72